MSKDNKSINIEKVMVTALKLPGVRIDRENYLRRALKGHYDDETIELAIKYNPAYAGINKDKIHHIAKKTILYENSKASTLSAAAGIPGFVAMAATVPADLVQSTGFLFRTLQKLAYLYGFPEFEINENEISDEVMAQIIILTSVMLGVNGANAAIRVISESLAQKVAKDIMRKALTKGTVYPMVKKLLGALGIKMTKSMLTKGAGKAIPVAGAVISGGLTFATFRSSCNRLAHTLSTLDLCDPEKQRGSYKYDYADAVDVEIC